MANDAVKDEERRPVLGVLPADVAVAHRAALLAWSIAIAALGAVDVERSSHRNGLDISARQKPIRNTITSAEVSVPLSIVDRSAIALADRQRRSVMYGAIRRMRNRLARFTLAFPRRVHRFATPRVKEANIFLRVGFTCHHR